MRFGIFAGLCLAAAAMAAEPRVVINEIMYHPPGDHQKVQFIELRNPGKETVRLGGWKLAKAVQFQFPKDAELAPGTYAIVARDPAAFSSQYGRTLQPFGPWTGELGHKNGKIELRDAQDKLVDEVKYSEKAPWPASADGYGASLERVFVFGDGNSPHNWSSSRLPPTETPGGTPGRQNDSHSGQLLPKVDQVTFTPVGPEKEMPVTARVLAADGIKSVSLLYASVSTGNPGAEKSIPMAPLSDPGKPGLYRAVIPPQKAGALIRFRIKAISNSGAERFEPRENDLRPTFSSFAYSKTNSSRIPEGIVVRTGSKENNAGRYGGPGPALSARGGAAFIYIPPGSATPELFDHIRVSQRHGGFKVRFHKDRTLRGMSVINIISEGPPRWILAEPLAYELYRMAGVPAELTEHIRVNLDGRQYGFMLLIEQPNKAFLARNQRDAKGDLFKLLWYGNGIVGKHEKKTNPTTGHARLLKLIEALDKSSGAKQWELIQKNFNVDEVASYFAVNMCIQNWDGFFNNYYAYEDLGGSGKWEIYPWDEDKTFGDYDGASSDYDWYEMPLSYGSRGDHSPRDLRSFFSHGPFGGTSWWRPPGYFSGPLLANPQFREKFLKRVRELCQTSFTEERFYPIIKAMETRLEPEFLRRAKGSEDDGALKDFRHQMRSFYNQVKYRRKFLLAEVDKELASLEKTRSPR